MFAQALITLFLIAVAAVIIYKTVGKRLLSLIESPQDQIEAHKYKLSRLELMKKDLETTEKDSEVTKEMTALKKKIKKAKCELDKAEKAYDKG